MTSNKIRDALKNVSGVEYLDLDSFKLVVDFSPERSKAVLSCRFDNFILSLRPLQPPKTKFIDLQAVLAPSGSAHPLDATHTCAVFTIGYNDQTKRPQLNWHDGTPRDEGIRVAVDVVVACMFAVFSTAPFPIPLGALFPKMEPFLRVVK